MPGKWMNIGSSVIIVSGPVRATNSSAIDPCMWNQHPEFFYTIMTSPVCSAWEMCMTRDATGLPGECLKEYDNAVDQLAIRLKAEFPDACKQIKTVIKRVAKHRWGHPDKVQKWCDAYIATLPIEGETICEVETNPLSVRCS